MQNLQGSFKSRDLALVRKPGLQQGVSFAQDFTRILIVLGVIQMLCSAWSVRWQVACAVPVCELQSVPECLNPRKHGYCFLQDARWKAGFTHTIAL
jgi:hypothetical protein